LLIVLVVVLAVATQLNAPTQTADPRDGADRPIRVIEIATEKVTNDGSGPVTQSAVVRINTMAAPELPSPRPDVSGIFVRREGDVIVVGTGAIEAELEVTVVSDEPPQRTVRLSHSGPEVEVVVNADTAVYREDTAMPDLDDVEGDEITIQQEVTRVASLDVGEATELQVWGQRQGDHVVAEVLAYRNVEEE